MIDIIRRLEEKGLAYAVGGDVYYAVPKFAAYGQLSGQSIDDLKAGARIEVGEQKQSPLDFALWKGAKPGEPSWESPWGPGRPGWHIECSAMAHRYLGEPFDIHGGGSDLIFPHHENEIAQSEGAFGAGNFARHWMHSGLLTLGGEKMSKSLGNIVTIRKVAETHDLEALRLLFIGVHYRSAVGFTLGRDDAEPAGLSRARRGRGQARLLLPDARQAGGGAGAGDDDGAGPARGREDVVEFPGSHGRRLQHRRRHRPPLRGVRARQQAARRSEGGAQGRAPPDAGAPAP